MRKFTVRYKRFKYLKESNEKITQLSKFIAEDTIWGTLFALGAISIAFSTVVRYRYLAVVMIVLACILFIIQRNKLEAILGNKPTTRNQKWKASVVVLGVFLIIIPLTDLIVNHTQGTPKSVVDSFWLIELIIGICLLVWGYWPDITKWVKRQRWSR